MADPTGNSGNAKKIRFAPQGEIYVADADKVSTLPRDCTPMASNSEFKALGYVDEGGVTITPSIETDPVNVWQSAVPVLYNVKSASFQIKATLMETNELTTQLFFGAKWVPATAEDGVTPIPGTWRLDLKSTPELSEIAIVVDWSQTVDSKPVRYRCVIGRAMISDRGAIQLQRAENGKFELTIDALDHSGSLGYVLTDDKVKDDAPVIRTEVTLQPAEVEQGGHFDVVGVGFKEGDTVTVTVSPNGDKFGAAARQADALGKVQIPVTVAADAPIDSTYEVKVQAGKQEPVTAKDGLSVKAKAPSSLSK
ncbi:hypothetical protein AB8O64_29825 [Streptomyces sp. QH1-20]|uniref:phage tail tube protein n=1 Tax=Streptomyces sp. QH1-20 TaxID=3240934 RepID=UPI0035124FEC